MLKITLMIGTLLSFSSLAYAKKTFIYCSEGSPSAFNPQITTDGTSNNAAAHTIYNRLVDFKYGTTEVVPALAESWKVTKKGTIYTFKLRKGVKFHKTKFFTPTREFNADDVIFSFNRQLKKSHPYNKVNGGSYEYWNSMEMSKLIKEIKKLDKHTVRITLSTPEAPFIANMAMSFMGILSKEYADTLTLAKKKEDIDNLPVGTGPFIFKKYVKDNVIRYTANDDYWEGRPKIDSLVFAITPDASVRYQKLKAGECHLIIEPAPADLEAMAKNDKIDLLEAPGVNVAYLAMNVKKKPFTNVKVRRAVNYALNRAAYIDAIYMGNAVVAKNPFPPNIWSYNHSVRDYDYNPKKAKQLLAKAGFPNGFDTEIWTLPVTRPYNPAGKKMGEMMQADLARVGIRARLITYEWATYLTKSKAGEHQMIQLGWTTDNGDPDNFLAVLLGCASAETGANRARWCNKDFNDLVMKAKSLTDQRARGKLYMKAQEVFKQRAPWVTIAHSKIFRAKSKKIKGYKIDPMGGDIFRYVDITE